MKKFKQNARDVLEFLWYTLFIPILVVAFAYWMIEVVSEPSRLNAQQIIELQEQKEDYILSDRFTEFDVIDTTWEKRGDSYDVYLLDTVESDVVQIAVYDTTVNDRFRAELYSGLE